jgi:hypothetical protein
MQMKADRVMFQIKNGKAHRLLVDPDTNRFPLGRAKCAPFERRPADTLHEPNDIGQDDFCSLCLKL